MPRVTLEALIAFGKLRDPRATIDHSIEGSVTPSRLVSRLLLAGIHYTQTFQVDLVRSCTDGSDEFRPQPSIGEAVPGLATPVDKALLE